MSLNNTQKLLAVTISLVLVMGVNNVFADSHEIDPYGIVINEVDINPPGNDLVVITEWVELYNPTDSNVDLGGWSIASTTILKKTMTIPSGTIITPGEFLTFQYQTAWFTDINEIVELRNEDGVVIDKTPLLSDIVNDFTSWQRIYDGYDTDIFSDWKLLCPLLVHQMESCLTQIL